ncbi:MAG: PilZ domain-containing protein [Leptospiraceae bacterium]|nr:PilZ domain-containing protein [Leptospiraceae bacterium]
MILQFHAIGNTGKIPKSDILNVSEGGLFLSTSEPTKVGDAVAFSFKLLGFRFSGNGAISWINAESKYNKPVGIGISFSDLKKIFSTTFSFSASVFFSSFEARDR